MKAYKMLKDDYRSLHGDEPPWTVGETRTLEGFPALCYYGYHGCPRWQDVFLGHFLYGTVAAEVELAGEFDRDAQKICAQTCTLLRAIDVSHELRRFAADCAERALLRQRAAGHEPDPRSWQAIHVARAYAQGKVTARELRVAYTAADATDAAAERRWQANHFAEMMITAFTEKEKTRV